MAFTLAGITTVGVTNPATSRPAVNQPVYVYNAGTTTLATCYVVPGDGSEIVLGTSPTITPPITSNANGNAIFAAAPAEYDLYYQGTTFATVTVEPDPRDPGWIGGGGVVLATTGPNGFALQNATPIILSWTAPADGQWHLVSMPGNINVTSPMTGGGIVLNALNPGIDAGTGGLDWPGGYPAVSTLQFGSFLYGLQALLVQPGQTVQLTQSIPLTAGAATVYTSLVEL